MHKKRGFTLVEVLVVVVLGAFLLLGVMQIFFGVLRGGSRAQTLAEVRQSGDFAMQAMERLIREGNSATCASGSLTITYVDSDDVILGKTSSTPYQIEYSTSSVTEYLTGPDVSVNNLVFACTSGGSFSPDRVMMTLELQSTANTSTTEVFTSSVTQRNY